MHNLSVPGKGRRDLSDLRALVSLEVDILAVDLLAASRAAVRTATTSSGYLSTSDGPPGCVADI